MRLYAPLRTTSLDPYQILALSRSADSKQIKQAYYALVKRHHPDRPSSSKPKDFEFKYGASGDSPLCEIGRLTWIFAEI